MSDVEGSESVAIVTGASRGIGKAIALELASSGYRVVVNYFSNEQRAAEVVRLCEERGVRAVAVAADVGSSDDRQLLLDRTLQEFGRLDVLVNNAGITSIGRRDVLEATEESWDRVMATNLKGPFFLSQLAANTMIAARGQGCSARKTIVNISSISAIAVSTNRGDYCIAKSAMKMMTELFAVRLADHDVCVFDVCPGVIDSDMTAPVREKYDRLLKDGLAPLRRWGQPADVARAVRMLVSGELPYATGDRLFVDGGFHIRQL